MRKIASGRMNRIDSCRSCRRFADHLYPVFCLVQREIEMIFNFHENVRFEIFYPAYP